MSEPSQLERVLEALPVDLGDCATYLPDATCRRLTRRVRVAMIAIARSSGTGAADQMLRKLEGRNDGPVSEQAVDQVVEWAARTLQRPEEAA